MRPNLLRPIGLILISLSSMAQAEDSIPVPDSWSFPQVIDSARKIAPNSVEGRPFNAVGLVYSSEELSKLKLSAMTGSDLQKYADIVTHAYPDAVAKQWPRSCDDIPVKRINETAVAGIAYVSKHAQSAETREAAIKCLAIVQKKLSQDGR